MDPLGKSLRLVQLRKMGEGCKIGVLHKIFSILPLGDKAGDDETDAVYRLLVEDTAGIAVALKSKLYIFGIVDHGEILLSSCLLFGVLLSKTTEAEKGLEVF